MIRKLFKKDNGYSLVELLIVIAIIIVLASGALISVTVIHSARAKDGAVTLGARMKELKTKSMNLSPNDGTHDTFALSIYNDANGVTHICESLHKESSGLNTYDYEDDDDLEVSSSVQVEYEGSYLELGSASNAVATDMAKGAPGLKDSDPINICFDKRKIKTKEIIAILF